MYCSRGFMEKLAQYPVVQSEIFSCKSEEQVLSEHAAVIEKHCNITNITSRVGVVGCQVTCSITLIRTLKLNIRLPQREDVWSMKERYCIDRHHRPSTVGPASG
jgi:hypothetical protein